MPWQGPEWDDHVTLLLMEFMDRLREGSKPSEALERVLPGSGEGVMLDRMARALGEGTARLVQGWGEKNDAERVAAMRRVLREWKIKRGYVT